MTLGDLSRIINRLAGGRGGESLCARWARLYGDDCIACRVVGWVLRDPRHCWEERLDALKRFKS